jgi:hypothetical protein
MIPSCLRVFVVISLLFAAGCSTATRYRDVPEGYLVLPPPPAWDESAE